MVCLKSATTTCVVQKEKTQTRITFNNLSANLTVNDLYKYVQLHLEEDRPFELSLVTTPPSSRVGSSNGGGGGGDSEVDLKSAQKVSLDKKRRSTLLDAGLSFDQGAANMVILISGTGQVEDSPPEKLSNGKCQEHLIMSNPDKMNANGSEVQESGDTEAGDVVEVIGNGTAHVDNQAESNGTVEHSKDSQCQVQETPADANQSPNSIPDPPPLPAIEYPTSSQYISSRTAALAADRASLEPCPPTNKCPPFVGLINQAMTCYLNSLLQALFMTPEFRNALYKWEFDGEDESKSIPYQLQRLFLNLQTSPKAVETTDLTRSFGWDSSEAWQQHDIQELCRVLFDALELKFKKTKDSDLINRLYQGKMIDYLKCLSCGTEKQREDTFLDIPLPVKPFGQNVAFGSIEEALRAFIQPEILNGNNQYSCDICAKKCDAHKGLKFSKFPYILTLHLKRFDFDYQTFHRIKLNDKVTFPQILNLNGFLNKATDFPEEVLEKTSNGNGINGGHTNGNGQTSIDEDEGLGKDEEHSNDSTFGSHAGPYMYELFAIMIHSGSASGGHYYVYIRDFDSGNWFCFNDQSVSQITMEDIQKSFGGNAGRYHYSSAFTSSTNAYMLMYRQIDQERNEMVIKVEDLPEHIQQLKGRLNERPEVDTRRRNHTDYSVIPASVYNYAMSGCKLTDVKIHISGDYYMDEVLQRAYDRFSPATLPSLKLCRLVVFDHATEQTLATFENLEQTQLHNVWKKYSPCEFLLEVRSRESRFKNYSGPVVHTRVYVVDILTGDVNGPHRVPVELQATVGDMKRDIRETVGNLGDADLRVALCNGNSKMVLENDSEIVNQQIDPEIQRPVKLFVSVYPEAAKCRKDQFDQRLKSIMDRFDKVVTIYFKVPQITPESRKVHAIPEYVPVVDITIPVVKREEEPTKCSVTVAVDPADNNNNANDNEKVAQVEEQSCIPSPAKGLTPEPLTRNFAESTSSSSPEPSSEALTDGDLFLLEKEKEKTSASEVKPKKKVGVAKKTIDEAKKATDEAKGKLVRVEETFKEVTENGITKKVRVVKRIVKKDPSKKAIAVANEDKAAQPTATTTVAKKETTDKPKIVKKVKESPVKSAKNPEPANEETAVKPRAVNSVSVPVEVVEEASKPGTVSEVQRVETTIDLMAFLDNAEQPADDQRPFFKVVRQGDSGQAKKPIGNDEFSQLQIQADNNMTISTLKMHLEPVLEVSKDFFKISRSRTEALRLNELVSSVSDGDELLIELGRLLQDGEYKYKVSYMKLSVLTDYVEELENLCSIIVRRDQRVSEVKQDILKYLRETGNDSIGALEAKNFRLWTKLYQNLSQPCVDEVVLGEDISLRRNGEFVLELLEGEPARDMDDFVIFIRKWNPDTLTLEPYQALNLPLKSDLKQRLSEKTGIPVEELEYARNLAPFPKIKISKVCINDDMDWRSEPFITSFDGSRNGHCYFYRDRRVPQKKPTAEDISSIQSEEQKQREAAKAIMYGLRDQNGGGGGGGDEGTFRVQNDYNAYTTSSTAGSKARRQERALKIYLDSSPAKVSS